MKKLFLFISLGFAFNAKADYWTPKAAYPGAGKELPISFSIGDYGYAGCGANANDFWRYDPATDSWTQEATVPGATARRAGIGFSINDKGYAGTGDGPLNDFYEYDPAANTWTAKASMSIARNFAAAFAIGTKGYVGGGNYLNDLWEYDSSTDVWTQKSDLPFSWWGHAAAFAIDDKGYFSTGLAPGFTAETWEYDPVTNSWTQRATMPGGVRSDARGFAICGKGYVMTGGEGPYYNDLWQFDPVLNSWIQKADIPTNGRDDGASFAIGSKGYFGLGQISGSTDTIDFWEYTPDSACSISNIPSASFYSSDTSLCEAVCIDFIDASVNSPTSWEWSFPGGNPSSSTLQNPTSICYYAAGTYDVILIATNNSGADTIVMQNFITVNVIPIVNITQSNDTLYSSPGNFYQWYTGGNAINGATDNFYIPPAEDFYTVVITDANGCTAADTISFSLASQTSFATSDTDICEKFCINFYDSSQNNPTSWLWNFPGGTPGSSVDQNPTNICYQNPGIFDVTLVTSNANGIFDTLTLSNYITVYTNPFAPVITQNGNTLTSTSAASYQWQLNSLNIPGATNQSYTITQSGLYTVIIGDANGCNAQASVDASLVGISDMEENSFVNIFPNPSSGSFIVEWLYGQMVGNVLIDVVNTLGQNVFSSTEIISSPNLKKEIELSDVARGVYFIEIKTEDEFVRKKILIAE
ncbi:MAG TPA: PKD domain-containing protein [Chitinophagales bacterium]|nr:PKD domain-containing protein [Chitinophagales bacterium]